MNAHVAVDARLAVSSGHRTYLGNLLPRLARRAPDWRWTLLGDPTRLRAQEWATGASVHVARCDASVYGLREQLELPRRVPGDATLFWTPHYNVPLLLRLPIVATIHDVAHLRLPEYTSRPLHRAYAHAMLSQALRRARAVLCVSEFTRNELSTLFGEERAGRATVVHSGTDPVWSQPDAVPSPFAPPYFVYVGNLKPHKNVGTLLAAFRAVQHRVPERLVIVGKADALRTPDRAALAEIAASPGRITLTGELSDAQLRATVRGATALVLPSLYEGFGLPPLEAMMAGCPAIVSRSGSLPEICGDAALTFDARDDGQLASHLARISADEVLRESLRRRGLEHARRFDWEVAADRTLQVLRDAQVSGA